MKTTHQLSTLEVPLESRGLLNSSYKEEVKFSLRNLKAKSLFSLKQKVKTRQFHFTSTTGTILKISIFVLGYILAFV